MGLAVGVAITAVAEVTAGTALESFEVVAVVVVSFVVDSAAEAVVDKQFVATVLESIVAVVVSIVVAAVVIVTLEDTVVGAVVVEPNNVAVLELFDTVSANLDPVAVVVAGKASVLGSDEGVNPRGTGGCR